MYISRDGKILKSNGVVKMPEGVKLGKAYDVIVLKECDNYGNLQVVGHIERFDDHPSIRQILYCILKHEGDYAEVRQLHSLETKESKEVENEELCE